MTTEAQALSPRHWIDQLRAGLDHAAILQGVEDDAIWSGRYLFMTVISAGIAMLGLLLSSPAVVIGAMLLSPLMGPIVGLGFGLAVFDLADMRRALISLALGIAVAVGFSVILSWLSPLQTVTPELAARTHPNLFDLVVALLSGLAGTYATMRSKQGAIVGVAIATAVMPPLATVGFGIATWNAEVAGGAAFLFFTNLMAIALAVAAMARLYGFGATLSPRQGAVQGTLIMVTLVALAIPLGLALRDIAWESLAQRRVREALAQAFPRPDRLGDVDIAFRGDPIVVNALVFTAKPRPGLEATLEERLAGALGQKVVLELEQVPLTGNEAPVPEVRTPVVRPGMQLAERLALVAGVPVESVLLDRQARLVRVVAAPLPGAGLASYRALERRIAATAPDWRVLLVPPPVAPAVDDPDAIVWAANRLDLAVVVSGAGGDLAETLTARGVQVEANIGRGPVAVRWAVPAPQPLPETAGAAPTT
ncbi:DUF389 domain-containing protein [Sandarakinorhabdus sp.]|uniref:DUF389 domain-containing protein n=1 Tax=Sandarakinorhabdus sp. TaxID=1916663 RepID=UPI003F6E7D92